MTTEDKMYLKENIIEYSKKSNKKIYIKTKNNKVGKEVEAILSRNKSELSDNNPWEKVKEGFSYKDFTLKFDKKDHANTFYNNFDKIMSATYDAEVPESPSDDSEVGSGDGFSSSNTLFIIAGIVVLAAIGLFVWKKGK